MPELIDTMDETQQSNRLLARVATRYAAYSVALFGLLLLLPAAASSQGYLAFDEGGAVEWFQLGAIAAAAMLLCGAAICYRASRPLLTSLCIVASIATVRELDSVLSQLVPALEWPGVTAIIVCTGFVLLWPRRIEFVRQASQFTSSTAFGLLWVGFVAVVAFAQLAGDHRIWQIFLPAELERTTRRAIQELCESFGYYLLLLGAVEAMIYARGIAREASVASRPALRLNNGPAQNNRQEDRRAA